MPLIKLVRNLVLTNETGKDPEGDQYGGIPYRMVDGQPVFLMITSRRSANWVFPKGSLEKGQTPRDTVAQEAFEEAGVRGEIAEAPIGSYVHARNNETESVVRVHLYPLLVTEQLEDWPEEPQRFRHWALLPQVRQLMASRQAARVAADFNRRLRTGQFG